MILLEDNGSLVIMAIILYWNATVNRISAFRPDAHVHHGRATLGSFRLSSVRAAGIAGHTGLS